MTAQSPLKVFMVAGEESGDRLGGALMRALYERTHGNVIFFGVGGDQMAAAGLQSLFPLRETALMGFASIPARLFGVLRRIRQAAAAAVAKNPDVLVIIDSPEFTHRIARDVRARSRMIPIVDYVSPSVWAWRPGRARAMREYIDHVMALLPFEPAVHARLGGPPCSYVGHPLTERVTVLRPNADERRRRNADPPILLIMPGSRHGEIAHMLSVFAQAAELAAARLGVLATVVLTVPELARSVSDAVAQWRIPARVIVDPAEKEAAFRTARAAIVKSGTGTLELAIAGVPMVAAYRMNAIEAFILMRLVKSPSVILANLVLGENIVPELLQGEATPQRIADAIVPLIEETPARHTQLEAFGRLDAIMEIGRLKPSDRAAQIVLDVANKRTPARN
jgi:lipid-A-disaccharide synthase